MPLLSKRPHRGMVGARYRFTVFVDRLDFGNADKVRHNAELCVQWTRGSKTAITSGKLPRNTAAAFEHEQLTLICTLFHPPESTQAFERKSCSFEAVERLAGRPRTRGKSAKIDLASYARVGRGEGKPIVLQLFKREVWERGGGGARREGVKAQLHEAYATAKELGELVEFKRGSVGQLRARLAEAGDDEAAQLRLQLETAAYKDAVGQLRELKPQIGQLQEQMQRLQGQMHDEFGAWHAKALQKARAAVKAAERKGSLGRSPPESVCRDRTNVVAGGSYSPRYGVGAKGTRG